MHFDNLPRNLYVDMILDIIRKGIEHGKGKLKIHDNENKKNQHLAEVFNLIGTLNEKVRFGVNNEHIREGENTREDIYFYLPDDGHTRVYYVEGKRLPKFSTRCEEEYVQGRNASNNPLGGIERYKLGKHGEPERIKHNGLIAYVENQSISEWENIINASIKKNYPNDSLLRQIPQNNKEYESVHEYNCDVEGSFIMHHFWIDLTCPKKH